MSFKISYAQNREDYLIDAFFPDVEKGFYIDIGANDPDEDSVTKIFYQKGWSGINVEPLEGKYKLLKSKRKRDINLQIGLSSEPGELTFRVYKGHGLSTFSNEIKTEHTQNKNSNVQDFEDVSVKVNTLKEIQKTNNVTHVHFMKVDVEGFEYEVLRGNDWKKNRPELICIEANHIKGEDWRPYLEKQKYNQVFHDGLNAYYLREESLDRLELFSYPDKFLAGPQLIKWTVKSEFDLITQNYENSISLLKDSAKSLEQTIHSQYIKDEALREALHREHLESLKTKNLIKNLLKRLFRK